MKLGMRRKLYNAEIRNRRLSRGLSQRDLAEKAGIGVQSVTAAECLRIATTSSQTIQKLAAFFGVPPDVLCPPWLKAITQIPREEDRQVEVTSGMLEHAVTRALGYQASGEAEVDAQEHLESSMSVLEDRERQMLRYKFGLGVRSHTYAELGRLFKITRGRACDIVKGAIKKLRQHGMSTAVPERTEP